MFNTKLGLLLGGMALVLALVHEYAGPFAEPTLQSTISEAASELKQTAENVIEGKEAGPFSGNWDIDRFIRLAIALGGGLAIVLGVMGFTKKESGRAAIGSLALGIAAIAFQYFA
jgi:hypothetical protein